MEHSIKENVSIMYTLINIMISYPPQKEIHNFQNAGNNWLWGA